MRTFTDRFLQITFTDYLARKLPGNIGRCQLIGLDQVEEMIGVDHGGAASHELIELRLNLKSGYRFSDKTMLKQRSRA